MVDGKYLQSWVDGPTRQRIVDFVARVTNPDSTDFIPISERIAVFDNDGTLWPEQPVVVQIAFTITRFADLAKDDPVKANQQPFKAAIEEDMAWFSNAVTRYYQGEPAEMMLILKEMAPAFAGLTIEEYQDMVLGFFRAENHPTLDRLYRSIGYLPMIELLNYLEAHDFQNFISSGGERDFMRGVAEEMYGIPPERVVGTSIKLEFRENEDSVDVLYLEDLEFFNDGPVKPMRIWSRIGKRPVVAVGNSNGDIAMMRFANVAGRESLRILVHHDDAEREFAYDAGAEIALARAAERNWLTVSMKNDWVRIFS